MSVYKNILQHSAIYSLGVVVSKLASVILFPLYTRYLTPRDYGVLELVETVSIVLSLLLGARLAEAFLYFFAAASSAEDARERVLATSYWGASALGVAAALIGWTVAPLLSLAVFDSHLASSYFRIAFVSFALSFPLEIGTAYLRAVNRAGVFVAIQLLRLALTILVNITLMVGFGLTIEAILLSSLFASIVLIFVCHGIVRVPPMRNVSLALLKQQIRYGLPLALSGLGMLIMHSGDRFFLQKFGTLEEVGLYSFAYRIGMLVGYAQQAFLTYWEAQMFSLTSAPGGAKTYVRTCTYYMLFLSAAAVCLAVSARPVISIMTPKSYHPAAAIVPLIAGAYVIRGAGDFFKSAFLLQNKTSRSIPATALSVIVTVLAYWLLIPNYRIWGAVGATAVTFSMMSAITYFFAQKVKHFSFEWARLNGLFVATGGALVFVTLGSSAWPYHSATVVLGSLGIFLIGLRLFGVVSNDEVDAVVKAATERLRRSEPTQTAI